MSVLPPILMLGALGLAWFAGFGQGVLSQRWRPSRAVRARTLLCAGALLLAGLGCALLAALLLAGGGR